MTLMAAGYRPEKRIRQEIVDTYDWSGARKPTIFVRAGLVIIVFSVAFIYAWAIIKAFSTL